MTRVAPPPGKYFISGFSSSRPFHQTILQLEMTGNVLMVTKSRPFGWFLNFFLPDTAGLSSTKVSTWVAARICIRLARRCQIFCYPFNWSLDGKHSRKYRFGKSRHEEGRCVAGYMSGLFNSSTGVVLSVSALVGLSQASDKSLATLP